MLLSKNIFEKPLAFVQHLCYYEAMDIKRLRKKLGLSQDAFAVKLGVAPMTVRRWESGTTKPSRMAQKLLEEISKKE